MEETPQHEHDWELIAQTSLPLLTYHNFERCKICSIERDYYLNPVGEFNI